MFDVFLCVCVLLNVFVWFVCDTLCDDVWSVCVFVFVLFCVLLLRVSVFGVLFVGYCVMLYGVLLLCCCCVHFL